MMLSVVVATETKVVEAELDRTDVEGAVRRICRSRMPWLLLVPPNSI